MHLELCTTLFDKFDDSGILEYYVSQEIISRSAHQTTNFTIPQFQFPQFKGVAKCFYLFNVKSYIGMFEGILELVSNCDINLKLLPGKNTQKVNKPKIHCKNSGFGIGCSMS